jgi:agmatine deiminase
MLRLPAEWEPQDAVLLAWPHADSDWEGYLDQVEAVYLELVRQITRFEMAILVVPHSDEMRRILADHNLPMQQIILAQLDTNDTWTRDFGPLCIMNGGQPRLLDFGFNGWGLKFACNHDNRVTRQLQQLGLFGATPLETFGLILEGGSLESDGRGTLLTTSQCLLEANRNPQLNKHDLEDRLFRLFGAKRCLWLDNGFLVGDDTDAHIDTLVRFAPDDTLLYVRCDQPDDEHYSALLAMEKELLQFRTAQGTPYRLIPLPWPAPQYDAQGTRLPATYANFLIINGAVLVPTYQAPQDEAALATISRAFPGREIIPVDCRPLIEQHGSLHCVTMQIPQGVLP